MPKSKFGEPGYIEGFDPEKAQVELEDARNRALMNITQQAQADWAKTLGPGGYEQFVSPVQQLAQQRINVPMQTAGAYSQSAGVGGPVGPAFPGMAELPAIQARVQGFTNYMNMLTGPMVKQLSMLDEESLQEWYNSIGKQQLGLEGQ